MSKRICFFSTGFAFNRLVRMRFYEKIFPKNVEIFLFTTDKYKGKEKEHYQYEWELIRTKVIIEEYSTFFLPVKLRKFCKGNKIDRIINIGNWMSCLLLMISTFGLKTKYVMNIFGDITAKIHTIREKVIRRTLFYPLLLFSKTTVFNDLFDYNKYKKIFGEKIKYIPAPVNTDLFKSKDKKKARKKLKLPLNKKIVIFVGRIDYTKGSDILIEVIKRNKDILFVVIGRLVDENFAKLKKKAKNIDYYEKKSSKELVDYYNAADLGFFVQRIEGGGLGLTSEECLACGVPAVNRKWKGELPSLALITVSVDADESDKAIKNFFKKSKEEREKLRKIAREFIEKNYSDNIWKYDYIKSYLR